MKQFSKRVFVHVAVIILVFMVTACVTQPAPEVVEAVVAEAAVVAEVACVTQPAPEVVVAVVTEAAVVAEAAAAPMAAAETFRIIGTNGLFELATATYAGGLGFTEVSAIVDYARAGYPTLVIDAGSNNVSLPDLHLGLEDGAALAAVLNAIGYDAMTPGIADLLFGAEGLQMLNAATSLQVVSANMEQNGELIFAPSALVEVGDLTIGILGLTSPHANKMGVEVSPVLSDLIATVEAAVNGLEKQGADFIVALTNMGFERAGFSDADLDWTAEYLSGHVDLIIDGMGSIPYQEIRGTTMYVQLGGSAYIGGLEITVQGDTVVAVDQLIITQDMIAGLEPNAEVQQYWQLKANVLLCWQKQQQQCLK